MLTLPSGGDPLLRSPTELTMRFAPLPNIAKIDEPPRAHPMGLARGGVSISYSSREVAIGLGELNPFARIRPALDGSAVEADHLEITTATSAVAGDTAP